jgi:ribosomal protein S18 acetylase RimI-like enzyme
VQVIALRLATLADLATVLPRSRALLAHEELPIAADVHEAAVRELISDASIGGIWLVEEDGAVIGYAALAYGYSIEFGGRDAYLDEFWIDDGARSRGAGGTALDLLAAELRARGVRALHLQVRPENPAIRLYGRARFVRSPRAVMTRLIQ